MTTQSAARPVGGARYVALTDRSHARQMTADWWQDARVTGTTAGFEDFLGHMWLAVHEGAFLFEIPDGAIDHTRDGIVRHGPWPPEDCSRCLLTWFDHGWITLYVLSEQLFRWPPNDDALQRDPDDDTARLVESHRARDIIAEPQTWTNDRAEGMVCLSPADHAPASDFRQLWLDAVDPAE
jgi:hypothetical protein